MLSGGDQFFAFRLNTSDIVYKFHVF
jgi:hypothetical protein